MLLPRYWELAKKKINTSQKNDSLAYVLNVVKLLLMYSYIFYDNHCSIWSIVAAF